MFSCLSYSIYDSYVMGEYETLVISLHKRVESAKIIYNKKRLSIMTAFNIQTN
jgi:hypothetical protein